jgi:hypothetical protein
MSSTIYHNVQTLATEEAQSVENLLPHFTNVLDVDDSPDLTDVHPRDRNDINLNFITVDNTLFPKTFELLKTIPGFINANIIGIGPQSQLYTHVDTVELKPYTEIDWTSVYIGMFVPSFDSKEVAVKVGNVINNHSDIILFDTQIPHSAWNWTDEWWVSIRVAVKSKTMQ